MTAAALLEEVAQILVNKGLERPRREALLLISDLTGDAVGAPLSHPEAPVDDAVASRVRAAARRRAAGVPLPYATGVAHFRTLRLAVDPRVLIPRPETEGLVERVLAWQAERGPGGCAIDVGTGSGCVALSLGQEGAFAVVVGSDLSRDALAVACRNAPGNGPVVWCCGDVLTAVADGVARVVVANPPYVTAAEWDALAPGVRDHEPRMALVAADDGLAVIDRLAREGRRALATGGLLALEVDSVRAQEALGRVTAAGFPGARIEDDLFGRPRYVLAIKE